MFPSRQTKASGFMHLEPYFNGMSASGTAPSARSESASANAETRNAAAKGVSVFSAAILTLLSSKRERVSSGFVKILSMRSPADFSKRKTFSAGISSDFPKSPSEDGRGSGCCGGLPFFSEDVERRISSTTNAPRRFSFSHKTSTTSSSTPFAPPPI